MLSKNARAYHVWRGLNARYGHFNFDFSLIGLIAPIVISALSRPLSRSEEHTIVLQKWKAIHEVATLNGDAITEETKQLSRADLARAIDDAQNLGNRLVTRVTTIYTLVFMFLFCFVFDRVSKSFLAMFAWQYHHRSSPQVTSEQFKDFIQQLSFALLITYALLMCLVWFWGRWKFRDYIWSKFRPGNILHFLLTASERVKAFTELVVIASVPFAMWGVVAFVSKFPFPLFPFPSTP